MKHLLTVDRALAKSTQPLGHQKKWSTMFLKASGGKESGVQAHKHRSLRLWGYGAFLLMSVLSASFYPVAKPALDHLDTALFLALQMLWLLPPALVLLLWSPVRISGKALLWGCGVGSCMSLALLCLTLAMTATSITETMIFSCLNSLLVVLLAWLVFQSRVSLLTGLACLCSIIGIVVLLSVSTMHWMGDLFALTGGLLLTGHSFLIEKVSLQKKQNRLLSLRTVFGVELLTMVVEMLVYALLFGNWQSVHVVWSQEGMTFAYLGLVTTFLPLVTMIAMRRYVNGVLLTFLSMLEPVAGAIFAFFFAHERFLPLVYLGGTLVLGSLLLQVLAASADALKKRRSRVHLVMQRAPSKQLSRPGWPQGRRAHILLAHLWSAAEGVDFFTLQRLTRESR